MEPVSRQVLRGWQRRVMVMYLVGRSRDFLAVATPGTTVHSTGLATQRQELPEFRQSGCEFLDRMQVIGPKTFRCGAEK